MVISEDRVHLKLNGHVYTMQENNEVSVPRRRRHSAAFKTEVVSACRQPGISVAAVALRYQLNANLLRRWVAEAEKVQTTPQSGEALAAPASSFISMPLPPQRHTSVDDIVIEVKRGAATVTIRWPHAAAAECANWLQGWLR
jgi:transposase